MIKVIGYKFVTSGLKSKEGNQTWVIGKWYKHKGELSLCESGFHACLNPVDSLGYVYGNRWFIVEARGKLIKGDDKFVAEEMRLIKEIDTKRVSVKFAVACARKCLNNYERVYPSDDRVRKAIEAAEDWLKNPCQATIDAAWSARSAAWSAESAAWSAAWSARSATWSAESAAWSAESAAWSAESAAWSAESAWSAARSAESAAEKWQERTLKRIIKTELGGEKK
jgi:hypothetical protein